MGVSHQHRILYLLAGAALPGAVVALALLWTGDFTPKVQWTLTVFIAATGGGFLLAAWERAVMPLQTLANLLEALREGDYSVRGRTPPPGDVLGEVMVEVNALGDLLRAQRFDAVDAAKLLRAVLDEIDVAVFTFDAHSRLRLVNRAGERMLAQPAPRLLGRTAAELGLEDCLEGPAERTFECVFPGGPGRWQARRSSFREGGLPHRLVVLADLSRALREEERQAWQRLIRVLGHELNNSLAPIQSTAATLSGLLRRDVPPEGWKDDAHRALDRIAERSASLTHFVAAYSRLARLPPPTLQNVRPAPVLRRVAALEERCPVRLAEGPDIALEADPAQLEQLLINLVKNAAEAALETGGAKVEIHWETPGDELHVRVLDNGPGLPPSQNLFVPFFTTKPGGTGIGLVLCRQIAEAHGGRLTLSNRSDGPGCEALLRLPLVRAT